MPYPANAQYRLEVATPRRGRADARAAPSTRPESLNGRLLAAGALAVTTFLVVLVLTFGAEPAPHRAARVLLLLVLVACVPIVFFRRWPIPVLALGGFGTTVEMASGVASVPLCVILGVGVYLTASRLPRRVSIALTLGTAVTLGAALLYAAGTVSVAPIPTEALEGFLPLVAAWFVGDSVAARRRYLAGVAEQAERERLAEEERAQSEVREERVRIARELHDVVAHTLAVITVQAGVGRRLMDRQPEQARTALQSIETVGRAAQDELRAVLSLLREQGADASHMPAPRLTDLKDLVDTVRGSGVPVELRLSGSDRQLSPAIELTVFRVVQEALTNVVRHAPGSSAVVDLAVSPAEVRLTVTNSPGAQTGAEPNAVSDQGGGHGIVGMRERVSAFGGSLTAGPTPDGGFRVAAELPVEGPL